ncbi:MAG: aspartate aminotransferase family protein [Xanthomonadaceae bacterium]|nr:aspartate aminotransferase family protein [Xanthomonadaceae bacterium]
MSADATPNDLESFWLPFTPNRQFKREPRIVSRAKDMHYFKPDGTPVLDATAGLWCSNAGHCRAPIVKAIQEQAAELDFAPSFQFAHPKVFELASRVAAMAPADLDHVFFCNSGSEAADTALKMAIAYHRANGEGTRTRLIGRERGYHGVGFGGISVGGMVNNRKAFGAMLPGVDHMRHTLDIGRNAFSKGLPAHGAELADDLERIVQLHDASTIAAVIVEPVSGSGGVVLPPEGYLQRLKALCDKYGILLIFDEVITGFGRVGKAFGAQRMGVVPDLMTTAKGLSNGAIPMGAVFASESIFQAFMHGPEPMIELFHGYTYSGHPVACAAALATLDIYREENLFERAIELGEYWGEALHSLKGLPNVIDIRNYGLIGAVEFAPRENAPGARGYDVFTDCFHHRDLMVRYSGDVIAMSPPLILERSHIDQIVERLGAAIRVTA